MQLSPFWDSALQTVAAFISLNSDFYLLNLGRTLGLYGSPGLHAVFYVVNLGTHRAYLICFLSFTDHCPLFSVAHCLESIGLCILSRVWVVKGGKVNPCSFTSSWTVLKLRIYFYSFMKHIFAMYIILIDNYFLLAHWRYHSTVPFLLLKSQLLVFNIPWKAV